MNFLKPKILVHDKKYTILETIGEGAYAFVYKVKCNNESKDAIYALKKLLCTEAEQIVVARKEVEILSGIAHANVLRLVESDIVRNKKGQDEVFMILPYYPTSLQSVIDKGNGYPSCAIEHGIDVVRILRHCAAGLDAIHRFGYRHGDFKPANVLLSADMNAVVTDLGSATSIPVQITTRVQALAIQDQAASLSTASFRAPELFDTPSHCVIDCKPDVWAFGCAMFATLFSRTPFESAAEGLSTLAVMSGRFVVPSTALGGRHQQVVWSPEFIAVIFKCLVVEAEHRVSMTELIDLLDSLPKDEASCFMPAPQFAPPSASSSSTSTASSTQHNPSAKLTAAGTVTKKLNSTTAVAGATTATNANDDTNFGEFATASAFDADFGEFETAPIVSDEFHISPTEPITASSNQGESNSSMSAAAGAQQEGDDDEFGEFESSPNNWRASFRTPRASEEMSRSSFADQSVEANFGLGIVHSQSNCSSGISKVAVTATTPVERTPSSADASRPVEEVAETLMKVILEQSTGSIQGTILKQGSINIMRPRGFLKTIVKKQVHLVLTKSGLVIRKSSDPSSKVHLVLSLSYPISINPTDTLSIGDNGALVRGYCPRLSQQAAALLVGTGDESLFGTEIIEDDDAYHLSHGSNDGSGVPKGPGREVMARLVEIGFTSRDEQGSWIDTILDHYMTLVSHK